MLLTYQPVGLQQMSLVRAEDYVGGATVVNLYWSELLRTVDEFDQLMEMQKREIAGCVREYYMKRIDLVKQFSEFKDSLRFEGEVQKREIHFVEMAEFGSFFKGYHQNIVDLIEKIVLQPKVVAQLISSYPDAKRIRFDDFLQNVAFNIYPCYLHASRKGSPLLEFMQAVLDHWPYNVDLIRPTQYSLLDQAISGLFKAPAIVCYVERIVSRFLQDAHHCHMSSFAFNEDAVKNQIQVKKQANATFSLYNQQKPSWKDKFRTFFGKEKEKVQIISNRSTAPVSNQDSFLSNHSDISEHEHSSAIDIMCKRQTMFFDLIRKTADGILQEQVPLLLCKMMACFDRKISEQISSEKRDAKLKHYCYFLMTNLILSELHNKFTISHQESGMSPADLQNISEIIKILNLIFQGLSPDYDKYHQQPLVLSAYKDKVEAFYNNILQRGSQSTHGQELLDTLLTHYEKSVVLSFNDISIVIALLQNTQSKDVEHAKVLQFLQLKEVGGLFDAAGQNRTVKFRNSSYSSQHIFFLYECRKPALKDVIDYYLTVDEPLADIPLIREILLRQSNLKLHQALEIEQDLKLIQRLPLKEVRGYLGKLAVKFRELRVKDGRLLQAKFQQSFRVTLNRSLRRKEWLLYYRSELGQRLSAQGNLMEYFTGQLNSAQFYERMAESFCDTARFKLFLNIQNNLFKVHKTAQDLKKIQISTLIVAKDDSKTSASNENYILRNSFKLFDNLRDLLRCLAKNQITRTALAKGRHPDDFNAVFQQIADIVVAKIKDFVSQKHIMQVLSEQKLAFIIVRRMQAHIYARHKAEAMNLDKDRELAAAAKKIDKALFWQKDLLEFGLDKEFLVAQGVQKFKIMMKQQDVSARLRHFGQLFKIIFTVLGFTMAKNKISAEIVNPLVQYIILQCSDSPHHECLFSLQALRWRETPQDSYHLTLYQSSLTYIRELMHKDYPLQ